MLHRAISIIAVMYDVIKLCKDNSNDHAQDDTYLGVTAEDDVSIGRVRDLCSY